MDFNILIESWSLIQSSFDWPTLIYLEEKPKRNPQKLITESNGSLNLIPVPEACFYKIYILIIRDKG
jgi:hypothetical protein